MSGKEYGIEAARKILGDLVRQVEHTGQPITLTRGNSRTPVAQITPLREHQMRAINGNPGQDVDDDTAEQITDLLRDGEGDTLRATTKEVEGEADYEVALISYTLNGQTRYAVVVSDPETYDVEDTDSEAHANTYYEQQVHSLTTVYTPDYGITEPIWDTSDVKDLPTGAVKADQQTLYWSVVRGDSPGARAVEPGPHDIDIPDSVLEWAAGHGLDEADPDVYLLVTTEDEAGEVIREIAYSTVTAPESEVRKVREALSVEEADAK